jgi:hypothetical protein
LVLLLRTLLVFIVLHMVSLIVKKHTSSCYKRNIWLYDKGNYDDLRRDL